jgi:predicted outer membrane repeat protein
MDYYAKNSGVFFSPDKQGITLYFMCGVHNCTESLSVYNLSSLSIVGTSSAKVIINMPKSVQESHVANHENLYTFNYVHNTTFENITINHLSVTFGGNDCKLTIKNSIMTASFGVDLNITSASASLVNCTLHNVSLRSTMEGILSLQDCLFVGCSSRLNSTIEATNSTIILSGTVKFVGINKPSRSGSTVSGGVLNLANSVVYVPTGGNVSFINNSASVYGGAVFVEDCKMYWFGNLWFVGNEAGREGGAIYMSRSSIYITGRYAVVRFLNNWSYRAGAISMVYSNVYVSVAKINFTKNSAMECGAVYLHTSNLNVTDDSSVIVTYNSAITLGGALFLVSSRLCTSANAHIVLAHNVALQGGGIYLYSSVVKISSGMVLLQNNTALDVGGGVYAVVIPNAPCFYYPGVGYTGYENGTIKFVGNTAKNGIGQHIYGSSSTLDSRCSYEYFSSHPTKPFCYLYHNVFKFEPDQSTIPSVVSSEPKRICLCDSINGFNLPQCARLSKVFVGDIQAYSGETFLLSVAVVGYDFGTTKGTIHAGFLSHATSDSSLLPFQYNQWIGSAECVDLNYTIFSSATYEMISLHPQKFAIKKYGNITNVNQSINNNWHNHNCIDESLLTTPVFINVSLLSCPPGFHQKNSDGQPSGCTCYQLLTDYGFKCNFINKTGIHIWNSSMWVSVTVDKILHYNQYCPLDYCKMGRKVVNLEKKPNAQCAFNHAGTLCGGCKENYSLAIGSLKCIQCSNNNVALLIFFASAGIMLVLFILMLNLTVTQGLINGIVLYANILWTYKPAWFPYQQNIHMPLSVIQVFVAWLNLDFGIESCFFHDFNPLWKTWLQFLFPLYIWAIAGSIIIASRYSSLITRLLGDQAVPLLATLFLLSYMKLIRVIVEALAFAVLKSFPEGHSHAVWYIDGNYSYCKPPHTYLFVAALLILLLLWCPYTLTLFLVQWLRKFTHLKCLRWITKFTPFYDANFAPLKDKHHYWFGVLLLVRGLLLLIFSLTFSIIPDLNLVLLTIVLLLLLLYTLACRVYKRKSVMVLESLVLGNLIVLSGSTNLVPNRSIALLVSIGFAFVQFCAIIVWSFVKTYVQKRRNNNYYVNLEDASTDAAGRMVHICDCNYSIDDKVY